MPTIVLVRPTPASARAAYFDDIFVGCIGCRVEGEGAAKKLYIMVLAVLAPYRGRGVGACVGSARARAHPPAARPLDSRVSRAPVRAGSELLRQALEAATKLTDVKEVYLHVWTANDDARRFYERHGFAVAETLPNYYRGISPPDCYVLRKVLDRAA